VIGNRLVAQLRNHRQKPEYGGVLCEFTVWFDETLAKKEREIIILNYLSELLKGSS
jgi:hypothetical protein